MYWHLTKLSSLCKKTPNTALFSSWKQSFTKANSLIFKTSKALPCLPRRQTGRQAGLSLTLSYQRLKKWVVFLLTLSNKAIPVIWPGFLFDLICHFLFDSEVLGRQWDWIMHLTPYEVLNGNNPAKDNYQNDIAEARKARLFQNQSIECCQSMSNFK